MCNRANWSRSSGSDTGFRRTAFPAAWPQTKPSSVGLHPAIARLPRWSGKKRSAMRRPATAGRREAQQNDRNDQEGGRDRPADERRRQAHCNIPCVAGEMFGTWGLSGETAAIRVPLLRRYCPAVTTVSPGASPLSTSARPSRVSPIVTVRGCTVPSGCTRNTNEPFCPCCSAVNGTVMASCLTSRIRRAVTYSPGQRALLALGKSP